MKNNKEPLRDIDISIANYSEEEKKDITIEVLESRVIHLRKGLLSRCKRIKELEKALEELSWECM